MLILNNEARVVILNRPGLSASDHLDDDFKIVLHPGANEVENAKWENFKDHRMVKVFMDAGYIEPREKGFDAIKSMSVREATDMAKLTVNKPALEKMLKIETRASVVDAIKKQIESLDAK